MGDSDSNDLVFTGSSPEECETFVSAIRKRALSEKKHHDDDWIAFMASSCFVGDALYWYEDLDKETQQDWSRLRPALLAQFGRRSATRAPSLTTSTSISLASTVIPTPAAAPPTQIPSPSPRRGRLKVLDLSGKLRGYLANQTQDGSYGNLTEAPDLALSVFFASPRPSNIFEISLVAGSQVTTTNDSLAIVWPGLGGVKWMKNKEYIAQCCSSSRISTKDWAMKRNVWAISENLELYVKYPSPGGGFEPLQLYITRSTSLQWRKSSWLPPSSVYEQARLIFEETI